jgi:hypothetical protein
MKRVLGLFDQGQMPTIACVNAATVDLGVDFDKLVAALQEFVTAHLAPVWGTPAKVIAAKKFPAKAWGILFTDTADVADALGYHDLTPGGFPLSHVFVKTTLADGQPVSVTASHELEMLVDPGIQMAAEGPTAGTFYAYEICDPVEAQTFKVNGIPMSNFVYPAWFEGFRKARSTRFDHLGKCAKPFQITAGGYMPIFKGGKWTQIFGSKRAETRWRRQTAAMGGLRRSTWRSNR